MEQRVCTFSECLKTFHKKSRLEYHMRSHTGEKPYKCDVPDCNKEYSRSDHLKRHTKSAHEETSSDNEKWLCESSDCEAAFKSRDGHKKHRKKCHSKQKYTCPVVGCEEEFRKHHQLKQHKHDVHHYTTAYSCSEPGCGKTFPMPSKLRRHMKTHEGYKCSEPDCGLKFDKWSLLVKHKRVVHVSTHQCPTCQKTFSQKQWLRQHMLTHKADRKAIVCPYEGCDREYLDQRNLNAHVRSYHEGKKFVCPREDCKRSFASKQKLDLHGKMHDPNRPLPKKRRRRVVQAEKLSGVQLVSEGRGHNAPILTSPNREDSIELPDIQPMTEDSNPGEYTNPRLKTPLSRILETRTEILHKHKSTLSNKLHVESTSVFKNVSDCEKVGGNENTVQMEEINQDNKLESSSDLKSVSQFDKVGENENLLTMQEIIQNNKLESFSEFKSVSSCETVVDTENLLKKMQKECNETGESSIVNSGDITECSDTVEESCSLVMEVTAVS